MIFDDFAIYGLSEGSLVGDKQSRVRGSSVYNLAGNVNK
jgi:hypothetical protein